MTPTGEADYREYVVANIEKLRRTAYLLCHDWHTADDVVSTTLSKLYDKWGRAKRADNLDGYVRAMLLNTWLDERRRPWRREQATDRLPDVADPGPRPGDHAGLLQLLQALPPKRRAVLVLRFYLDHTVEETAEMLGISTGTVKSQTARGLETLRLAISKETKVPR